MIISALVFFAELILPSALTGFFLYRKNPTEPRTAIRRVCGQILCSFSLFVLLRCAGIVPGAGIGRLLYFLIAAAFLALAARIPYSDANLPAKILRFVLRLVFSVFIVLTVGLIWGRILYQNVSLEEIVYYANMPLNGTAHLFWFQFGAGLVFPALVLLILYRLGTHPRKAFSAAPQTFLEISLRPLRFSLPLMLVFTAAYGTHLYRQFDDYLSVGTFIQSRVEQSSFIEEHYADPQTVSVEFPEKKRNLIWIFMESAETTPQDKENGGVFDKNYIPEMTELAKENVSFSQSDSIQGAAVAPACGWTMAGMAAQTSGLPLKLYKYGEEADNEAAENFTEFMPGATTLGDLLKANGYTNELILGSDAVFGGRQLYFTEHGDYRMFDYGTARYRKLIPEDYYEAWGFEDTKLYELAKGEITAMAESGEPFHAMLLTIDTHSPGFPCSQCEHGKDSSYGDIISCSSRQVAEFVEWCKEQPFYENTTIIITGDHASMEKSFYETDEDTVWDNMHLGTESRFVYNCILNSAVQTEQMKNRKFTTLDFFPTALASIGVKIEGDRLGLGTNLFSDRQTLSEEYGYEELFEELNRKSLFYDKNILYAK